MIRLKSLLESSIPSLDEASEELYGIRKQPKNTCPMIDAVQKQLLKIDREFYKWERHRDDADYLAQTIQNVEGYLSGFNTSLEQIRENVEEIRAWGQEWKDYAKEIDPKVPPHQQPQNLPQWGSLT